MPRAGSKMGLKRDGRKSPKTHVSALGILSYLGPVAWMVQCGTGPNKYFPRDIHFWTVLSFSQLLGAVHSRLDEYYPQPSFLI
jgi:hypothetical protein